MRSMPKTLKLFIIAFVLICVGATAIHAWQGRAIKAKDEPITAKTPTFDWQVHNNAHMDALPAQVIENSTRPYEAD